jgi:hypothetical protein
MLNATVQATAMWHCTLCSSSSIQVSRGGTDYHTQC